jgi:hypothetical protein
VISAFERGDELSYVLAGDASGVADLDAAELAGAEQVVDFVAAGAQHLGDLRSLPPPPGMLPGAALGSESVTLHLS